MSASGSTPGCSATVMTSSTVTPVYPMSRGAAATGPGSTTPVPGRARRNSSHPESEMWTVLDQVAQHADRCRRILLDAGAVADIEAAPDLRPEEGGGVLHVQGRRKAREGHVFRKKLRAGSICVADEVLHSLEKPVPHPLAGRIDDAVHRVGDRDHAEALPFCRMVDCFTLPVQRTGPHQAVCAVRVVVEKRVAERRDPAAFIVSPGPALLPPGDRQFPRPAMGRNDHHLKLVASERSQMLRRIGTVMGARNSESACGHVQPGHSCGLSSCMLTEHMFLIRTKVSIPHGIRGSIGM